MNNISSKKLDSIMTEILKHMRIEFTIVDGGDNGVDGICGIIYLHDYNRNVVGNVTGYSFFYRYSIVSDKLICTTHFSSISTFDQFKVIPRDLVIRYFSDKVENYLKKLIEDGKTTLIVV